MRGALAFAIALLMLASPTAIAPPPQQAQQGGLANACGHANSNQPCILAGVIPTTTVGAGQAAVYEGGEWTVDGTITVQSGGSLSLHDATFRFTANSGGIVAQSGAVLTIVGSTLEPKGTDESPYVVDAAAGSTFTLNTTRVLRGNGVKVATSALSFSGNSIEQIGLGLFLNGVTATIHHNQFLNNTVAVNQTGGVPTLDSNKFVGGEVCVSDWLTDPTISNNVFRGCHVGILHRNSASTFLSNDMEDEAAPPGVGILVENTNSPVIEGNRIANYGTGVLVKNATAYIRNNEIVGNVGDGVRVESNTQPMDIQNNTIAGNGGSGIRLVNANSILVQNNSIQENAAHGMHATLVWNVTLTENRAKENALDGFRFEESSAEGGTLVAANNGGSGVVLSGEGFYDLADVNASGNAGHGFDVDVDGSVTLLRAIGIANVGDGLHHVDGSTSANDAWWEDNAGEGVENVGDTTLVTECSYWGSASGPTHPDNPGGTGDEVEGAVDFFPYRTDPALTSCVPEIT